jgi:hypothetical protein
MPHLEPRAIKADRGPSKFRIAFFWVGILLCWGADTTFRNVIWRREMAIGFLWPPVKCASGYFEVSYEGDRNGEAKC